jgi:hypothetical protein
MTAKASPVGQHWGKDVGCALETAVDAASGSSYATGRTEPSTIRFSTAINRHSPTPLLGHSGVGSTQILSKKSLYGVCDSLAKKLTSPVGLQTAAEHRLRVRRPLKTLRERRSATSASEPAADPFRAAVNRRFSRRHSAWFDFISRSNQLLDASQIPLLLAAGILGDVPPFLQSPLLGE